MRCGRIIRMVQTTARCMCILKQAENAIVNIRFLWMMQIYRIPRTARTGKAGNVSTEHEYQILGLVPGMKNYITLAMYNSDDELSEKQTFSIDIPASPSGASAALTAQKGRSKVTITNGLYVLFQDEKAKSKAILMYDNSGILRSENSAL